MTIQIQRYAFTVEEYYKMAEAGIFTEDDRVELIDGEIVEVPPIGSNHASHVDRIATTFAQRIRDQAIVRVQSPVRLSERSEPVPDVTLLNPRADFYASGHPGPEDVLLLIEVADTTVSLDRQVKAPMYARSGISEYWLVDLNAEVVEVYRDASPDGYRDVTRVSPGQRITPLALPDASLAAEDILG